MILSIIWWLVLQILVVGWRGVVVLQFSTCQRMKSQKSMNLMFSGLRMGMVPLSWIIGVVKIWHLRKLRVNMISHSFNYKHQDKRTILFNNNNSYRETVNLSQKMKKYIIKSNQTLNIIVNSKGTASLNLFTSLYQKSRQKITDKPLNRSNKTSIHCPKTNKINSSQQTPQFQLHHDLHYH